jgi:hypothetical protein
MVVLARGRCQLISLWPLERCEFYWDARRFAPWTAEAAVSTWVVALAVDSRFPSAALRAGTRTPAARFGMTSLRQARLRNDDGLGQSGVRTKVNVKGSGRGRLLHTTLHPLQYLYPPFVYILR